MRKWLAIIGLVLLFALGCEAEPASPQVVAALPAETSCRLTVQPEGEEIDGLEISACRVAALEGAEYTPAEGFEASGLSISGLLQNPSAEAARQLLGYIEEKNIPSITAVTEGGKAVFAPLEQGIWLVYCREGQSHRFDPFLAFLPHAAEGALRYELTTAPKTAAGSGEERSIYVVKRWADENNAAQNRPESIIVELSCNGAVVERATLSAGSGWSYTFGGLPKEGAYRVTEQPVRGYTAQYSGDAENGFIITNTPVAEQGRLPQTGQLWWPIALLVVAGLGFIALGLMELKGKKDEKSGK